MVGTDFASGHEFIAWEKLILGAQEVSEHDFSRAASSKKGSGL
jgi:hypothetical protein